MAQMPPKAPSMAVAPNWPHFSHPHSAHNPSWVDDFLHFSSAKRGSHRRSASDSVAFLEMPLQDCRKSSFPDQNHSNENNNCGAEFERFDEEQLMSMFTDDVPAPTMSSSDPSSPSNPNSFNEDPKPPPAEQPRKHLKTEPADQEVQSLCKAADHGQPTPLPPAAATTTTADNSNDKVVDPKRIKRILANRQSAQRSRVRKLHYISELERSVTSLQAEVSVLSPRVAFFDHQRMVLTVDNGVLKQRIAALAQDKIFKDAHQEALKREIERLRQIYYQQKVKKVETEGGTSSPHESKSQPSPMDTHAPAEEQLANGSISHALL